ncbi:unnamed protein product [Heligmosomoides polygyrus]|uniref:Transposase n=1 Tax=Heligmosomoides polygyrus TaxID=6339 RepID=A0A183FVZ5_HELPZ|nr:unnamed protein product [Heligmosomoides polygyrus]
MPSMCLLLDVAAELAIVVHEEKNIGRIAREIASVDDQPTMSSGRRLPGGATQTNRNEIGPRPEFSLG